MLLPTKTALAVIVALFSQSSLSSSFITYGQAKPVHHGLTVQSEAELGHSGSSGILMESEANAFMHQHHDTAAHTSLLSDMDISALFDQSTGADLVELLERSHPEELHEVLRASSDEQLKRLLRAGFKKQAQQARTGLSGPESLDWLDEMRLVTFASAPEDYSHGSDLSGGILASDGVDMEWMTELDKMVWRIRRDLSASSSRAHSASGLRSYNKKTSKGLGMMDVTDTVGLGIKSVLGGQDKIIHDYPSPTRNATIPEHIRKHVFPELSTSVMRENLKHFSTAYRNRYYRAESGKQSGEWLKARVEEYASANPHITVRAFAHTWAQSSVIAHIPSAAEVKAKLTGDKPKEEAIVIVGAHQDSTNLLPFLPAPGADDDGSGTNSILDAFRVLAKSKYLPDHPVEFHWYSAEEGGLLGSQAIAKDYESKGKKVKGMIQMDMTAWVKAGSKEVIGVITDFVDPSLTEFVTSVVESYCDIPPVSTQCGYACSDHASWTKAGYQSAFSIESTFADSDKNIHSTSDTINYPEFSFEHMQEFSKLAIGFVSELAGGHGKK